MCYSSSGMCSRGYASWASSSLGCSTTRYLDTVAALFLDRISFFLVVLMSTATFSLRLIGSCLMIEAVRGVVVFFGPSLVRL